MAEEILFQFENFARRSTKLLLDLRISVAATVGLLLAANSASAQTPSYADMYDFGSAANAPVGGVGFDAAGDMFGTTYGGGVNGGGMVWEVTAAGVFKDLHDFGGTVTEAGGQSGPDGEGSLSAVSVDPNGNIYGTTELGGANSSGMLWKISTAGVYTDLHDFGGILTNSSGVVWEDGQFPQAGVTFGSNGSLYGTTTDGGLYGQVGIDTGVSGAGMVWQLSSGGVYTDLHDFGSSTVNANGKSGADGFDPASSVAVDSKGNLYGTCLEGGASEATDDGGDGIVWEITTTGGYIDLHDFGGNATNSAGKTGLDGTAPCGNVNFDASGNLYGTASSGGAHELGMVWKWSKTTYINLHDFGATITYLTGSTGTDGDAPYSGVTLDSAGDLFGTSDFGGAHGHGVIWEYSKAGAYTDQHDFGGTVGNAVGTSVNDGFYPQSGLTIDSHGNMWGVAPEGGANGKGMVYTIGSALQSLAVSPTQIVGGDTGTGAVTLRFAAPAGGIVVNLASKSSLASVPQTVTVPAGSTGTTFTVSTVAPSALTYVTLTATQGNGTISSQFVDLVPSVVSLSLHPSTTLVGGTSGTSYVSLNGPAPTGGLTVKITSTSADLIVTSSVTIPAGQVTVGFTVSSNVVSAPETASFTASLNSSSKSVSVSIILNSLASFTIKPSSITGGTNTQAYITLTGPAGPNGTVVTLTSSSANVTVPASVTIPAGQTTLAVTLKSKAVLTTETDTITATYSGASQSATLTLTPAAKA